MTNPISGMTGRRGRSVAIGALAAALAPCAVASAAQPAAYLDSIHRQTTLSTTVPENGDQNPYAIVVAQVSVGAVQKDDVLVTNFNNDGNLQGLGTTIVDFDPTTKKLTTFASLPRNLGGRRSLKEANLDCFVRLSSVGFLPIMGGRSPTTPPPAGSCP